MQSGPSTWRELLDDLSEQEKRYLIEKLGIQSKTLERWINGHTELPRASRLRQLLYALPANKRTLFASLLQRDPKFMKHTDEDILPKTNLEIPSAFYKRVIQTNALQSGNVRFTAVCQLIILQLLSLLDGARLGFYVAIFRCTPPAEGQKVRSLQHQVGMGTHPWNTILTQASFFVGSESLAGRALFEKHGLILQDIRAESNREKISRHQGELVASAAAFRIQREERVAGVLVAASTQPHFFIEERVELLHHYRYLSTIAFDDYEFYSEQMIELGQMPSLHEQLHNGLTPHTVRQ